MDASTINELLAGSVGGAAQVIVGQPLDTIKTRAQTAPSSVSLLFVRMPDSMDTYYRHVAFHCRHRVLQRECL